MTMTIPTLPTWPAGHVVTLAELAQVSYAATFLLGKPIALITSVSGAQAITTSYAAFNKFGSSGKLYDPDGMWSSTNASRLTVQTPGWYRVSYGINCGATGGTYNTVVQSTTGSNNPAGSGIQSSSYWGGYADTDSGQYAFPGGSGVWPFYLYAGDYLQIFVKAVATGSSTSVTGPASIAAGSYFGLELVSI